MNEIEILRFAADVAETERIEGLPPNILRFVLEYENAPTVTEERNKLAKIFSSSRFMLEYLDEELPQFLVLQFPGVERRIAPQTLFAIADDLASRLELVSCVPDIGVRHFIESPGDLAKEDAGGWLLNMTCWAKENDTLPKDWAIKSVLADQAWQLSKGDDVLVAHPDSGWAEHVELDGVFDLDKAFNVLEGSKDARDPLSEDMENAGHGISTASTLASRAAGSVYGAAPAAKVAPIRCLNSVVLKFDGTAVAKAIMHAVRIEADVISMSLGGAFYFPSIAAALNEAVKKGIIVVAAGGNCVQPIVVYPARDPNSIALAGVDINDRPWKGTSRGKKIDVCAPAENVFTARREPNDDTTTEVGWRQGTSYATAITAGVAALWISHFGRDAIRQEAARRQVTVNELFRAAIRETARPPKNGTLDPKKYGAGIVDAKSLLELQLNDIPNVSSTLEAVPTEAADATLDDKVNAIFSAAIERGQIDFDWKKYGPEALFLAIDSWRRSDPQKSMILESPAKPSPSPELKLQMPAILKSVLGEVEESPLIRPPVVGRQGTLNYVKALGARSPFGVESSSAISIEDAVRNIRRNNGREIIDKFKAALDKADSRGGGLEASKQRGIVAERAAGVLRKVVDDDIKSMDIDERVTMEALVRLTDRPSLRVDNGTIDPEDPLFGEWGGSLFGLSDLPVITSAVGRIDLDGQHVGTASVVGSNKIMTNRHVLEAIADEVSSQSESRWFFSRGAASIDFSDKADGSKRFQIRSVLAVGRKPIHNLVDFSKLDMAILEVEGGPGFPTPLGLLASPEKRSEIFTLGYPARPATRAMIDPNTGSFSIEVSRRLSQIYNLDYGRKYLSPGIISIILGEVSGDPNEWTFAHDTTTLGGNSGSVVVEIGASVAVTGLHFAGTTLTANYAHSLAAIKDRPDSILADISLNWV